MEPGFFRTGGSSGQSGRLRARRRNQLFAGAVVVALMIVALWAVLPKSGDKDRTDLAAKQADENAPAPRPGDTPVTPSPAPNNPAATPAQLSEQGHVPLPSPGPVEMTAERKKELADKFAQAEAALVRKELLAARTLFNEVVDQGLEQAVNDKCVQRLVQLANDMILSRVIVPGDPTSAMHKVAQGETLDKISRDYKIQIDLLQSINGVADPRRLRVDQTIKIVNGPFNALVDKSDFTLSVYLDVPAEANRPGGPLLVRRYKVGLGEFNSTPTGVWKIKSMDRFPPYNHPRTGKAIAKDAPDYPFGKLGLWMALEGVFGKAVGEKGMGIHSTNEPQSIGKQASLGCIRLSDNDMQELWRLLRRDNSRVTVRE